MFSVEGDFDVDDLKKVEAVPKEVGTLAIEIETLVSCDDCTIGDMDSDIVARIASTTMAGIIQSRNKRRISLSSSSSSNSARDKKIGDVCSTKKKETPRKKRRRVSSPSAVVPNPLIFVAPVPNPLKKLK